MAASERLAALAKLAVPARRAERAAWRLAIEAWLQQKGLIGLSAHEKSVTTFSRKAAS